MKENFISKLPIKIIYSIAPLIKELEASDYNFGEFKAFLEYLKETAPGLIDGINNYVEFERQIKKLEPIIEKIVPKPLIKYNLKGIIFPFSKQFIFKTDRLRELLEDKEYRLKFSYENIDYMHLYKYCCTLILSKYYKINIEPNFANQLEIINSENGYKTYLGTDYNYDYLTVYPSEKKYELSEEELEDLLNNFENNALWLEKIPIGSWVVKGFNIVTFFDNTTEIAISKIKTQLITYGESFNGIKDNIVVDAIKSIFRINNLEGGFSAYNAEKNIFEINRSNTIDISSMILEDKNQELGVNDYCSTIIREKISKADFYVISNVEKMRLKYPMDKVLNTMASQGIKSLIVYPLMNGNDFLGILQLGSNETGVFNRLNAEVLKEITPLFEESIYRHNVEFENKINAYIQTEFTSLHSSVNWKFREKAIVHFEDNSTTSKQKLQVSFHNVYPIYGEIDVRNSSQIRNECMRIDYQNQINYLIEVCNEFYNRSNESKFLDHINALEDYLSRIDNVDKIYFESELFDYITYRIHPEIPQYILESEKSVVTTYLRKLDKMTGLYYIERKKFDQSIQIINSLFSNELDRFQVDAQKNFPHYYERFKTDGIDYNLYIGKSINPRRSFNYNQVKKLRYWQLESTIAIEISYYRMIKKIPLKMEVASLILTTNTTLDIMFKLDEKRFDVNGYNNAKYEIIKKRIKKAFIKGTPERINQPGKICIVYSDEVLKEEYLEYIYSLIEKNKLKKEIEFLEIDDLQGVNGLNAIRVSINYGN